MFLQNTLDCTVNDAAIEEMILLFALDILSECLPPSAPTPCFFYTPDEKRSDATAFADYNLYDKEVCSCWCPDSCLFFRRSVFRSTSEGSLLSKVLPQGRICISDSIELYFRCWNNTFAKNHLHAYTDGLLNLTRRDMLLPKSSTDLPTNGKGGL